ncbi:putative diacylglycerol O-acyltransferase tgs1 [Zalaria obscura]|uniref:Diacylglycerol O-acyltransferase tgs1 n=1 Tax=Zalaria obscura TaxID=2024903 RepID=A0ACC3SQA2_9PEZI
MARISSATDAPDQDGIHHYDESSEMPAEIQKYWHQRYDIFSKYDEGIWMTDDTWFGVTPEPVASVIASHIAEGSPADKTVLIDAFAGAGGNTIAFALSGRWQRIFAIEKDPKVLACAKHNAAVYGVSNKIWWIQGDCFDVLKKRLKAVAKEAVIFASPPWGGPGYRDDEVFDLSLMQPYSLSDLYVPFAAFTPTFVLFLPRSSDLNQIAKYTSKDHPLEVTHYCMHGASKRWSKEDEIQLAEPGARSEHRRVSLRTRQGW